MPKQGADSSNYSSPAPPSGMWAPLAAAIDCLFPQSLTAPPGYPQAYTREQCQWALDNGLMCIPYIWKWFGTGIEDIQRRLDILTPFSGMLDSLSMDIEDTLVGPLQMPPRQIIHGTFRIIDSVLVGPNEVVPPGALARIKRQPPPDYPNRPSMANELGALQNGLQGRIDEVAQALELIGTFPTKASARGIKPLIYSGGWYWTAYMGNTEVFRDHPYWGSFYDGVWDVNVWNRHGGWTDLAVKQPFGTSTIAGVGGLDPDVLADWYVEAIGSTEPPADPYADVVNALGYIGGDVLRPLTRASAAKYVKTAVAEVRRVCEQLGIQHA